MVLVVPIYEVEQEGVFYNTAFVIDADGTYLGKYRKHHIPQVHGFWEKYYFRPGNLRYPIFDTAVRRIGVDNFYGSSYFVSPRGQLIGEAASDSEDEVLVRDFDMNVLKEVRHTWA